MSTDPAEQVLDRIDNEYLALYEELQRALTAGLSELALAKLTNPDLSSELKTCNFTSPKAHCRVLVTDSSVELVGAAPRLTDIFHLSPSNPNLHRAKTHFTSVLTLACRVATVKTELHTALRRLT